MLECVYVVYVCVCMYILDMLELFFPGWSQDQCALCLLELWVLLSVCYTGESELGMRKRDIRDTIGANNCQ